MASPLTRGLSFVLAVPLGLVLGGALGFGVSLLLALLLAEFGAIDPHAGIPTLMSWSLLIGALLGGLTGPLAAVALFERKQRQL
jgi:hypothetical protein